MEKHLPALPTATASLHLKRTRAGAVVKIRVVTPQAVYWRTYEVPAITEQTIIRALQSVKIPCAWVQLSLL